MRELGLEGATPSKIPGVKLEGDAKRSMPADEQKKKNQGAAAKVIDDDETRRSRRRRGTWRGH